LKVRFYFVSTSKIINLVQNILYILDM
jgi:hypothetical protein